MHRIYKIVMFTPIGARYGTITMTIENDEVTGFMDILNQRNVITGRASPDGSCIITGNLTTPYRDFSYVASGTLSSRQIHLTLSYGSYKYRISGDIEEERL